MSARRALGNDGRVELTLRLTPRGCHVDSHPKRSVRLSLAVAQSAWRELTFFFFFAVRLREWRRPCTRDVTPNLEVALEQAAAYAARTDDQILVGYYHANELAADDGFGKNASKIADVVCHAAGGHACALLLDPARLSQAVGEGGGSSGGYGQNVSGAGGGAPKPAVTLLTRRGGGGGGGGWERAADQIGSLAVAGGGCAQLVACHRDGLQEKLVDFDDHFDDLTKDWRNLHLDDPIATSA